MLLTMEKATDHIAESTFSFGIEPITKRAYHHTSQYAKRTRTRCHKGGLKYCEVEVNPKSYSTFASSLNRLLQTRYILGIWKGPLNIFPFKGVDRVLS